MKTLIRILFFLLLIKGTIIPQSVMQNLFSEKNVLWEVSEPNPYSNESGSIGIRGGIGTDINLGLVYGGGINYLLNLNQNAVEIGLVVFGGNSEETTEDYNTYTETTDVLVYGVLANYLFGYELKKSCFFGLVGFGFTAISVEWEESSPDDESLGTPLPGGGSKQSEDATAAGSVLNLGFGIAFDGGFDIRVEAPIIFIFDAPGDASSIVPTFMATLGYHF
jgi:hypothetical protein